MKLNYVKYETKDYREDVEGIPRRGIIKQTPNELARYSHFIELW